jgi:hypothetical protein
MRYHSYVALWVLLFACGTARGKSVARDEFLRPYVQQLKKDMSADDRRRIAVMAKTELILLLHGYGTGIRNKWLHGGRDPRLVQFFRRNGITDPEEASMVIIEAVWHDLNSSLPPAARAGVEAQRATVARKRANYELVESECRTQLAKASSEFDRCYASYGLPSKNPMSRDPFFKLLVGKSGAVRKIIFFEGASPELKICLARTVERFRFSPFTDDEFVTLYIVAFPNSRVAERDTLHE